MAITQDEMQSIVSVVLSAIRTNSQTIDQLTPVTSLSDNDSFEINGGKKVTYGLLKNLVSTASGLTLGHTPDTAFPGDEGQTLKTSSRVFLSVEHTQDGQRLVVHGLNSLLQKGLSPVLFRCLRRSNDVNNDMYRHRTRRWVRFTKQKDAIQIDNTTGEISFSTTLFNPGIMKAEEWSSDAHVLLLRDKDSAIVYGRRFFYLSHTPSLRMLYFPFALALVDDSVDWSGRLTTRDDAVVWLPFGVRYTPVFNYALTDDNGEMEYVRHKFSFDLVKK